MRRRDCDEDDENDALRRESDHIGCLRERRGLPRNCGDDSGAANRVQRDKFRTPYLVHQAHAQLVDDGFDYDGRRQSEWNVADLTKRTSATTKSATDNRFTLPPPPVCAPKLTAAKMTALLAPPSADMTSSRVQQPCISRRISIKNDIMALGSISLAGARDQGMRRRSRSTANGTA